MNHHNRLMRLLRAGGGGVASYTISGYAYDADGTTGVVGATVALGAYTGTSGAGGAYTITGIPAGTSGSMTCTLSGYSWTAITVAAMSGNLTAQNYTNAWWAAGGTSASCVVAYQPKGAATYAASKINLANPGTNDAADGAAYPTWDATNGWKFAKASSQYLDTTVVESATTWSVYCKYTNLDTTVQTVLFGASSETTKKSLEVYFNAGASTIYNQGGLVATIAPVLAASGRVGVCYNKPYRNGAYDGSDLTGTSGSPSILSAWIGGLNTGTLGYYSNIYIQAFVIHNVTLSAATIAIMDAGMVNL